MYQKIKEEMVEIISIVNSCPENLQQKCFEVMLTHLLDDQRSVLKKSATKEINKAVEEVEKPINEEIITKENKIDEETEIVLKDYHIKIRKFFETSGITCEDLNKIYYKSENAILPLYEELKTTNMRESQLRLSLLTAFENSINNDGDMITDVNEVRIRCQELKCYDTTNFASNFNKFLPMFDGFDKYEKGKSIKLSLEGKKELSKTLLELSRSV